MVVSSINIPNFFDDALGVGGINSSGVEVTQAAVTHPKCLRIWLQSRGQRCRTLWANKLLNALLKRNTRIMLGFRGGNEQRAAARARIEPVAITKIWHGEPNVFEPVLRAECLASVTSNKLLIHGERE